MHIRWLAALQSLDGRAPVQAALGALPVSIIQCGYCSSAWSQSLTLSSALGCGQLPQNATCRGALPGCTPGIIPAASTGRTPSPTCLGTLPSCTGRTSGTHATIPEGSLLCWAAFTGRTPSCYMPGCTPPPPPPRVHFRYLLQLRWQGALPVLHAWAHSQASPGAHPVSMQLCQLYVDWTHSPFYMPGALLAA